MVLLITTLIPAEFSKANHLTEIFLQRALNTNLQSPYIVTEQYFAQPNIIAIIHIFV